jgi:Mce-associated membrane protein
VSVLGAVRLPRRQGKLEFSRGAAGTLAVVAVVALVALVVQLFTVRPDYLAAEDVDVNRGEVVRTAEQFTLLVNTFDAKNVDQMKADVTPLLTTKFQDSFEKTADELLTQVSSLDLTSEGEVLQSAVASQDTDSAQVLVVADARAESDLGTRVRHFRWQVDLVKVDGSWLVDNFSPVA